MLSNFLDSLRMRLGMPKGRGTFASLERSGSRVASAIDAIARALGLVIPTGVPIAALPFLENRRLS